MRRKDNFFVHVNYTDTKLCHRFLRLPSKNGPKLERRVKDYFARIKEEEGEESLLQTRV